MYAAMSRKGSTQELLSVHSNVQLSLRPWLQCEQMSISKMASRPDVQLSAHTRRSQRVLTHFVVRQAELYWYIQSVSCKPATQVETDWSHHYVAVICLLPVLLRGVHDVIARRASNLLERH